MGILLPVVAIEHFQRQVAAKADFAKRSQDPVQGCYTVPRKDSGSVVDLSRAGRRGIIVEMDDLHRRAAKPPDRAKVRSPLVNVEYVKQQTGILATTFNGDSGRLANSGDRARESPQFELGDDPHRGAQVE